MTIATAHSNIALVKYWGKRDANLNLPATGSLSMTLAALTTTTTVTASAVDAVMLAGTPAPPAFAARVTGFLDVVADALGVERFPLRVETRNDFPTAAGLASSASGFAALTLAAVDAFGGDLAPDAMSGLARRGSGSAARSIHGGWVEMSAGKREDGTDAVAHQLAPAPHWDLRCVVLITAFGEKSTGSTDGMERTSATSPYYPAWVSSVDDDLRSARKAVAQRDFDRLATVAERSCMRMHASAMGAAPAVLYFNGATVELIHRIRALRAAGHAAFFTIDAGPHVKVFCSPDAVDHVIAAAEGLVVEHIVSEPGGPATLLDVR